MLFCWAARLSPWRGTWKETAVNVCAHLVYGVSLAIVTGELGHQVTRPSAGVRALRARVGWRAEVVDVGGAAFEHEGEAAAVGEEGGIGEWIAVDDEQIGVAAGFEGAVMYVPLDVVGVPSG